MKIYDTKRMFEEYDYEICEYCEHSDEYYQSDSGYREMRCGCPEKQGDCQTAIREMLESKEEVFENEEDYLVENKNGNEMNLTVDLESLKRDIIGSIKNELKNDIMKDINEDLIKQTYEQTVKPQLEEIKTTMTNLVGELLKKEVESYYTEKKITIGGGYYDDDPAKEFTIQEYTQDLLAKSMKEGKIEIKKSKYDKDVYEIKDYIIDKCIADETKRYIDKELKTIQKNIDKKMKDTFKGSVEKMMSEVALGVLTSNATYKDITQKLIGQ